MSERHGCSAKFTLSSSLVDASLSTRKRLSSNMLDWKRLCLAGDSKLFKSGLVAREVDGASCAVSKSVALE